MKKQRNSIEFKVSGRYALFADPIMRVGGEKFSYQVPIFKHLSALQGTGSLYFGYCAVRVMNKIRRIKV